MVLVEAGDDLVDFALGVAAAGFELLHDVAQDNVSLFALSGNVLQAAILKIVTHLKRHWMGSG